MSEAEKKRVQEQFGASAASYATSEVHAKGASLKRLVELVRPQSEWEVLDIATAAGHTALAFAPFVSHVTATDLTPEMLPVARALAEERGVDNITLRLADAENLPFEDDRFDLVTCRIAPHHFPDASCFVSESARVLRPGGVLAIVDNIVPGSRIRGKKGKGGRMAGEYINAFEKLRDPSHHRCLSIVEWEDIFAEGRVALVHQETLRKEMDFEPWAERMHVTPKNKVRLRAMLVQAPDAVKAFLTPNTQGARISFFLTEAILIGRIVGS